MKITPPLLALLNKQKLTAILDPRNSGNVANITLVRRAVRTPLPRRVLLQLISCDCALDAKLVFEHQVFEAVQYSPCICEIARQYIASAPKCVLRYGVANRGQITGGTLDGPLALDNAISAEAARIKGIRSSVAGRANVLVAPDLEAANMLAKSLSFLAKADAAGIVLGARVPIILTSRADSVTTRLASCAVASLVAKVRRENPKKAIA
jgi:hypothetical protein